MLSMISNIAKAGVGALGSLGGSGLGGPLGSALGGLVGKGVGDLGELVSNPLGALARKANPIANLWGDAAAVLRGGNPAQDLGFTSTGAEPSSRCGSTGGTKPPAGGGSIFEKIFAILQKLQDQLNKKVGELDGLDPKNDKAALDKGLFEVQQLQQQMTQLTSMATNLASADHNSKKGIVDNFNIR